MGCGSSKLDTLPAVALCHDRCELLNEAIRLRFNLAEAHLGYMKSLKEVGSLLHTFFEQDCDVFDDDSLVLALPSEKKEVVEIHNVTGSSSSELGHSHHLVLDSDSASGSSSHLDLTTDSDEGENSSRSFRQNHLETGITKLPTDGSIVGQFGYSTEFQQDVPIDFSNRFMHTSYMTNQAVSSVLYEQKQFVPKTGYMDQSSYYDYSYGVYDHGKMMDGPLGSGYLNYGGGYGSGYYESNHRYGGSDMDVGSRVDYKPPPPPPSPPKGSSWDFLNPFESVYDLSYSAYLSSRELKEVREEEGIPELEEADDDDQSEAAKKVYDNKPPDVASGVACDVEKLKVAVETEINKVADMEIVSPRREGSVEDGRLEYEVHKIKVKVAEREERITAGVSETSTKDAEPRCVSDVLKDIQAQFYKASETGNELAELLDAGRLSYHKKHGSYLAPSKMLHAITPALPVLFSHPSKSVIALSSSLAVTSVVLPDIDIITGMKTKSLANTLQKLYLWEKKLWTEVKAEEKMRVLHDRKRRKLMQLDAKGADAGKVVATRALVRSLGTKMKVSIQVADRISNTLNKIRDEELWPHINQVLQGLTTMWESMLECHRSQFQAIREAGNLDAVISHKKLTEANLKVTLDLEHELIRWALRFSSWITIQKDFAKALNNWLYKCLLYEPEVTPDGVAPFSPSRIGAPPIFVICNEWVQALDQSSEKEVLNAMQELAVSVFTLWERDRLILRQNMVINQELEKQVRSLDREDHKIRREIQALDKHIVSVVSRASNGLSTSDQYVNQTDAASASLHDSLQHVFDSMEKFTAESTKVYKELLLRSEEEIFATRNSVTS